MNIISNLIFHCNNCDANRAFVTIRENTAAAPSSSLLNAKFTFKGTSPPIIFTRIVRPMNALQLSADSFHTGVTAEALRAKIDRESAISHQLGHFDPKFQV